MTQQPGRRDCATALYTVDRLATTARASRAEGSAMDGGSGLPTVWLESRLTRPYILR